MERTKKLIGLPSRLNLVDEQGKVQGKHSHLMHNENGFIPQKDQMYILVNDPSICAWGFAILCQNKIMETGCIKTTGGGKKMRIRKGDDTIRRIREINQVLLRVIKKWDIAYMVSELPHGSQNASAAVMQGIVSGIMQTLSDSLEIGCEWYSEGDSKKCLLGKNSAEKKETIDAISKLYGTQWKSGTKYIDEAVADALSIHYVASKQSSTLQLFNK